MAKKIDLVFITIITTLSILGVINFFSASYYFSLINLNNPYFYFQKFLIRITILGIFVFLLGNFLGKNLLKFKKIFILLFFIVYLSIFLGFLTKFRLQESSARFVNLGFISFQPSEILKPFAILFFIFLVVNINKFSIGQKIFIFSFFFFLVLTPIFLQPSYSNVLIIALPLSIIFLKSLKTKSEFLIASLSFLLIFLILTFVATYFWEYRLERLISFLTKGEIYKEKYFQVEQSILAISSGGIWGKGLGNSEIKILGLPQLITDSIFSVYAEEWGFLGSLILLLLFLFLIMRIIIIGSQTGSFEKETFCFCVAIWILLQTFLHLATNLGLFVPTGVILPFFSYGPSGQLALYFSLGLIHGMRS